MKRKICGIFFILVLLLCLIPKTAVAAEGASDSFFGVLISDTEGNMNTGGSYYMYYEGLENEGQRMSSTNNFVSEGEEVNLMADPKDGYRFVGWFQGEPDPEEGEKRYAGEPLTTERDYQFTAPIELTRPYVCAVFEKDQSAHYGDQVQMWVGNTDGRDGGSTVMGGKVAVKYTPSWDVWPDAIVARDGTDFVYGEILQFYKGDECTVYAKPDEGYRFVGWYHVNIEWGPGGGKSYEGDVISTETSFTYKPGETIVDGDIKPLRYVCAVFEEASPETRAVSFEPGTGKGSMAPVTVAAGEEYELPACTFSHENAERKFYKWSVNDELKDAGDTITVNEDTVVTAKWKYTDVVTTDNSIDKSTTEVTGSLKLTDLRTGSVKNEAVYDETTSSGYVSPETPTTDAMIEEALDVLEQKAQDYAGESAVTKISEGVENLKVDKFIDSRTYTYYEDQLDAAGDYCRKLVIEGDYWKIWHYTVNLTAEYTSKEPVSGFTDVQDPTHPYYKAIYWAADKGITRGYKDGSFGIDRACTRSEAVMFLWRLAGTPEPKTSAKSPFSDVPKTHAHYKAILWASQNGITKGYSDGTFGINKTCTRGQIMTFIWRFKREPAPKTAATSPFSDVPKNHAYYRAILWGSQNKITNGFKDGTFGINRECTRGQIVTFLYRIK